MSQPPGLLVMEAPRRGKPPRHLVDMTLAQRREVVVAAPAIRSAEMPSPRPTSRNSDPKPHRMSAERHMSSVSHACMVSYMRRP